MTPTRCKCGELHGLISKNPFFLGGGSTVLPLVFICMLRTFWKVFFKSVSVILLGVIKAISLRADLTERMGKHSKDGLGEFHMVDWIGEKKLGGFIVEHCGFDEIYCTPKFNIDTKHHVFLMTGTCPFLRGEIAILLLLNLHS